MATLSFIIEAQNRATETIKQVESQLSGMEKKTKSMEPAFKKMAAAGTVAFGALTAAVGLSVKAFQEQEVLEAKLETLLKNATNATDEQVNSLKEQASALQSIGVVGDEVIIALQAQLATFELNTDTIKKMTPAILDMIVAEKGVNATTEDMISFGNAFGMAMEGNYASLTKRGFKIDENTKKMIELGTEEQKATAITEYLNSVYEGTNKAMRETSAGGLKALKNSFGDLQEEIGEVFIPLLIDIVEKLTPMIDAIGKWIEQNPELTRTLTIVGTALAGVVASVGLLGLAIPKVTKAIELLNGAILMIIKHPIILLITAVTAGVVAFINELNKLGETVGGIGNAWQLFLLSAKASFLDFIATIIEGFSKIPIAGKLVEGVVDDIRKKADEAQEDLDLTAQYFTKMAIESEQAGKKGESAMFDIDNAVKQMSESLEQVDTEEFEKKMTEAMKKAADGVKEIKEEIEKVHDEMMETANNYLKSREDAEKSYNERAVDIILKAEEEKKKLEADRVEAQKKLEEEILKLEEKKYDIKKELSQEEIDSINQAIEEKRQAHQKEMSDFEVKIKEQENILQTYTKLGIDLSKELEEERKRASMNELERLTYDHNKKMELIEREFLEGVIYGLLKQKQLQEELDRALDYIGREKEEAINAELEKTKTFREQLAEKTSALGNWFTDTVEGYRHMVNNVNAEISRIATPAPIPVSAYTSQLGGYQFGTDNVPRTGMYMLHKGESVSPAGSGGVVVNINGGYYMSERAAEDMGDKIIERLKREVKL